MHSVSSNWNNYLINADVEHCKHLEYSLANFQKKVKSNCKHARKTLTLSGDRTWGPPMTSVHMFYRWATRHFAVYLAICIFEIIIDSKTFTNSINNFDFNLPVCIGTNGRMSVPSNREFHYKNLRDRYTNCTYVDGNLEITWIQNNSYDLSFLQHIREVTVSHWTFNAK